MARAPRTAGGLGSLAARRVRRGVYLREVGGSCACGGVGVDRGWTLPELPLRQFSYNLPTAPFLSARSASTTFLRTGLFQFSMMWAERFGGRDLTEGRMVCESLTGPGGERSVVRVRRARDGRGRARRNRTGTPCEPGCSSRTGF